MLAASAKHESQRCTRTQQCAACMRAYVRACVRGPHTGGYAASCSGRVAQSCLAVPSARLPYQDTSACLATVNVSADDLSGMYYGARHPMKPQRITMTHHLILGYRLHEHMDVYVRFSDRFFVGVCCIRSVGLITASAKQRIATAPAHKAKCVPARALCLYPGFIMDSAAATFNVLASPHHSEMMVAQIPRRLSKDELMSFHTQARLRASNLHARSAQTMSAAVIVMRLCCCYRCLLAARDPVDVLVGICSDPLLALPLQLCGKLKPSRMHFRRKFWRHCRASSAF